MYHNMPSPIVLGLDTLNSVENIISVISLFSPFQKREHADGILLSSNIKVVSIKPAFNYCQKKNFKTQTTDICSYPLTFNWYIFMDPRSR